MLPVRREAHVKSPTSRLIFYLEQRLQGISNTMYLRLQLT
jgi:hypothetical protein